MTNLQQSLFSLMDSEEDDFPTLLAKYGIDPAIDLQHCDLSNVDFGKLVTDTLNLTGSNITGANLSKVRCKQLIGADRELITQTDELAEMFQKVAVAIQRYQNSDWVLNKIAERDDNHAPIVAFYDSAAEQDVLTKRVCEYLSKGAMMNSDAAISMHQRNFLWFYTRADKSEFKFDPAALERNFLKLFTQRSNVHDIGVYPFNSNRNSVRKVEESVTGKTLSEQRTSFARAVGRELTPERGLITVNRATVLFSGYPPISRKLYDDLRACTKKRLWLIFLCSSQLERYFNEADGKIWRKIVVPAYSVGEQMASKYDIPRLLRRIVIASENQVTVGSFTRAHLDRMASDYSSTSLTELKSFLLKQLNELRATARPRLKTYVL